MISEETMAEILEEKSISKRRSRRYEWREGDVEVDKLVEDDGEAEQERP